MSIKKALGERLQELCNKNEDLEILGINEDAFNKYLRGDRFPRTQILEKIKNYYNVPYSYLLGEYDNKDIDTSEISGKLGLSNKSINKIKKIMDNKNSFEKDVMLYALNKLIEDIDFLEFGKLLLVPNNNNKYIKSDEIYEYFSYYINNGNGENDYFYDIKNLNKKREYNDFILNKRLFELFKKIRGSKECAKLFTNYVDEQRKEMNDIYNYLEKHPIQEEDIPYEIDEEMQSIIDEQHKQMEIRNKKIVDNRKNNLGI